MNNEYLKRKPSWNDAPADAKYLVYSIYMDWFWYKCEDPWLSTHFVDYVEDRNGDFVPYKNT